MDIKAILSLFQRMTDTVANLVHVTRLLTEAETGPHGADVSAALARLLRDVQELRAELDANGRQELDDADAFEIGCIVQVKPLGDDHGSSFMPYCLGVVVDKIGSHLAVHFYIPGRKGGERTHFHPKDLVLIAQSSPLEESRHD